MSETTWTTLADVPSQPVKWLWEGWIPFGKVTLLDGEPGFGKSNLALDLAARVSRGLSMPLTKEKTTPADVVIFNNDDNLSDTVRPRLEAAGADLTRIRAVDHVVHPQDFDTFHPALIILDPLTAYLCLGCDVPPRQVIKDLARLAKETPAAVLVVQHLPKNGSSWTAEIYDAARSVLQISSIGHNRRRLTVTKSNLRLLSEMAPLVFQLEDHHGVAHVGGWSDGF
jgi:DNA repair protein RadA/Sms